MKKDTQNKTFYRLKLDRNRGVNSDALSIALMLMIALLLFYFGAYFIAALLFAVCIFIYISMKRAIEGHIKVEESGITEYLFPFEKHINFETVSYVAFKRNKRNEIQYIEFTFTEGKKKRISCIYDGLDALAQMLSTRFESDIYQGLDYDKYKWHTCTLASLHIPNEQTFLPAKKEKIRAIVFAIAAVVMGAFMVESILARIHALQYARTAIEILLLLFIVAVAIYPVAIVNKSKILLTNKALIVQSLFKKEKYMAYQQIEQISYAPFSGQYYIVFKDGIETSFFFHFQQEQAFLNALWQLLGCKAPKLV